MSFSFQSVLMEAVMGRRWICTPRSSNGCKRGIEKLVEFASMLLKTGNIACPYEPSSRSTGGSNLNDDERRGKTDVTVTADPVGCKASGTRSCIELEETGVHAQSVEIAGGAEKDDVMPDAEHQDWERMRMSRNLCHASAI
ncbi:hypothetical protein NL676_039248 [Syzygium grande]|nr:hypothetical protein NL676_039248 [Syzygium grande]